MKFSAKLIMAMIAWRSCSAYDTDYRETSPFFDSSPPFPSRPKFPPSFTRHIEDSFSDYPRSFSSDFDFSDRPPQRSEQIIFDSPARPRFQSSYFSKAQSYYKELPSSLAGVLSEYRGPPPPVPRKQQYPGLDERPAELQATISQEDQDQSITHAEFQTSNRQPLSFGGHANHLEYGNHALGFASVPGVNDADLNPIAIAEQTLTTTGTTESAPTPSEVQVSQQQSVTNPSLSSTEAPAPSQTTTSSTDVSAREMKSNESTTPSTTMTTSIRAESNSESTRNTPSQPASMMMFQEAPRTSYDFRTVTQEQPAAVHGQLPIEAPKEYQQHIIQQHTPDIKQNFLVYQQKGSSPFQQLDYQQQQQQQQQQPQQQQYYYQQQLNYNNNDAAPVRFSIPTSTMMASDPKLIQGLDLSRSPLAALTAVSGSNTFNNAQNQIVAESINRLNIGNSAPHLQSYFQAQNQDQTAKPSIQSGSGIPLGSFYLIPRIQNYGQTQQVAQINSAPTGGLTQGSQLPLAAYGGVEFLISSSNSETMKHEIDNGVKAGLNLQQQFQSPEQTYTKIGFGQTPW